MWMSDTGDPNAKLTFDLGDVYMVTAADIWQYNAPFGLDRGVKEFNIYNSIGGIDFDFLTAASLSKSTGESIPAQNVEFSTVARYIRFNIITNYGDLNYSGLSEVKFDRIPNKTNPIPEPATIFLLSVGLLGITRYCRKKKICH